MRLSFAYFELNSQGLESYTKLYSNIYDGQLCVTFVPVFDSLNGFLRDEKTSNIIFSFTSDRSSVHPFRSLFSESREQTIYIAVQSRKGGGLRKRDRGWRGCGVLACTSSFCFQIRSELFWDKINVATLN